MSEILELRLSTSYHPLDGLTKKVDVRVATGQHETLEAGEQRIFFSWTQGQSLYGLARCDRAEFEFHQIGEDKAWKSFQVIHGVVFSVGFVSVG